MYWVAFLCMTGALHPPVCVREEVGVYKICVCVCVCVEGGCIQNVCVYL